MSTKVYKVGACMRSLEASNKFYFGVISITKNLSTGEIFQVRVLNKFIANKKREDMTNYFREVLKKTSLDIMVSNIKDYSNDSIYYPPIMHGKTAHELCLGYKDLESVISYPKGSLLDTGIKLDDRTDDIKYRFDFDNTPMLTYAISMAIDSVRKNDFYLMMQSIKDS